jgi:hypothetical protein
MAKALAVRRVPWTCKWGRFGGPVRPLETTVAGFVFWTCDHPNEPVPRPLDRGSCDQCPYWEMPEDADA